jgi:hypothetical protein
VARSARSPICRLPSTATSPTKTMTPDPSPGPQTLNASSLLSDVGAKL